MNSTADTNCQYCGMGHTGKCPMISAIEYHEDGSVKRVEFYAPQPTQQIPVLGPTTWPDVKVTGSHTWI